MRLQTGQRLTINEKQDILVGLSKLAVDFFSKYITNDELGSEWMEVSPCNNICLSNEPYFEREEEIPSVFQESPIRTPVPRVSSRIRKKRENIVTQATS